MTSIQVAWTMMATASLTLGLVHLLAWLKLRTLHANLAFFVLAGSVAGFALFELAMMSAQSPEAHATAVRWAHVPLFVIIVSLIAFTRLYFGVGNRWLAAGTVALRSLALVLNFATGTNLNYLEVASLERIPVWGTVISIPVGTPNPWQVVAQASNLLLLAFVAEASVALWRSGEATARRRAVLVGGSIAACIAVVALTALLTVLGAWHVPTVFTAAFLLVVFAMAYELSSEMIAASRLARQLAASEARFRAVVEAAPNAILVADDEGRIALTNSRVRDMFGYAREELIGQPVELLVPARLRHVHEDRRTALADDPRTRTMGDGRDVHVRRRDGSELPVEVVLTPIPAHGGRSVLVSLADVSERRRREHAEALQRSEIAHLSRVAMLGEMAGSLAHELNQPLTAILSNAQAAQRLLARLPAQVDALPEILDDIVRSDRRAGEVIQRLRALLRKEPAVLGDVDVNDLVVESLRLMRSELLARRVDVQTDLAAGLPSVRADRVQLQQLLLNLVINACEAMEASDGAKRLAVRSRGTGAGTVEIAIVDEGEGLPATDPQRIFEPFVTTKSRGLGLGLAICRSIAESHGGRLWAESNDGPGATFFLELPVRPA